MSFIQWLSFFAIKKLNRWLNGEIRLTKDVNAFCLKYKIEGLKRCLGADMSTLAIHILDCLLVYMPLAVLFALSSQFYLVSEEAGVSGENHRPSEGKRSMRIGVERTLEPITKILIPILFINSYCDPCT